MKTIYKYEIYTGSQTIEMPKDAEILCVQRQLDSACVWAIVETSEDTEFKKIDVFRTGHPISDEIGFHREYIGTYQEAGGGLIWHVFERIINCG